MGFLGVYQAVYDYEPRADGELAISEGDLLYVLEKNEDDGWWKAKKKAGADDEDEPVGLVPNNYVEEAPAVSHARAIYEYTRQTDEELSFPEEAILDVFDTSDPDWILVGYDGEYGFGPANYIDMDDATSMPDSPTSNIPPTLPVRPQSIPVPSEASPAESPRQSMNPAAALAGVIQGRSSAQAPPSSPPPQSRQPAMRYDESQGSEDGEDGREEIRSPALPSRPRPGASRDRGDEQASSRSYAGPPAAAEETYRTPGGFHLYNINEMTSIMGKKKKMPTTLGINLGTGTILIAPERAEDDPPQEWTADKMTHYSREGKHVFMELVRPSKSIDFHAGAKDTAEEIVRALGELAGAVRAEGLREVIMAGSQHRQRKGQILYDFMAQGDDEVTVAAGDEVIIVDDSKSEEWWQVRRQKNGKEGVVPSSYVEITGTASPPLSAAASGMDSTRATVEQNRLEEIRLTKEAIKASKEPQQVGSGMSLPDRGSSLAGGERGSNSRKQRSRRENGRSDSAGQSKTKSKPDSSKVRTWTDRSGSFSVEAQFLGLKDGKLHLHKMNGVKIAVPIAKMSRDDLEYVENATGISLDDDKPLADVKRAKSADKRPSEVGASVGKTERPEYDWFQFFLSCDVPVGLCERYAQAFIKDSMDESVLPDVNATILRTLGLREGDIIKVMRTLDTKFGRDRTGHGDDNESSSGGLFSGPGGALRNNTRKGRPAPAVQTSDVVDASAFSKKEAAGSGSGSEHVKSPPATLSPVDSGAAKSGFDDDAWDVKPNQKKQDDQIPSKAAAAVAQNEAAQKIPPTMTGSMKDLSLLSAPLEPSRTQVQPSAPSTNNVSEQSQSQQPAGASPSFFSAIPNASNSQITSPPPGSMSSPKSLARQRPAPPSLSPNQGSLAPPPPQRPLSAPLSVQTPSFPQNPMLPQMTGSVQGQVAPAGQSLNDIAQARLQQQYTAQMQHMQPGMSVYPGVQTHAIGSYPTGAPVQPQFMQPMMTGMAGGAGPFADPIRPNQFSPIPAQPTGFPGQFPGPMPGYPQGHMAGGNVNSYLPQALEPQRTGATSLPPQQTGFGGNPTLTQPLQPQKTGPPPPVRFGVTAESKKLTPQQTGRRANLAQATPDNPFGF